MDQLVFTRYLYPKMDVQQSLLIAMLEKQSKEALFWAYELYYSGQEKDTFEYLTKIYESYYKSENPDIEDKLFSQKKNECLIGSIVLTLCARKYQICHFLKEYKGYDCKPMVHEPTKMKFIIQFKETDLVEYLTILPQKGRTRLYLNRVCKYSIRRQYNELFESSCDDYQVPLCYHWIYYGSRSHYWLDHVEDYSGLPNDEKQDIDFPNDDLLDAFYDHWGLEPDEQSKELHNKLIGNYPVEQLSIEDFCEKFGGIPKPVIANTIVYVNKTAPKLVIRQDNK
jgi:hypothetical protein